MAPHDLPPRRRDPRRTAPDAPRIELRDVAVRLGDRLVFEGSTWTIRDGERWAIAGPNGSGKSTLVRALSGELPIVGGRATYRLGAAGTEEPGEGQIRHVSFDDQRAILSETSAFYQSRYTSGVETDAPTVARYLASADETSPRHDGRGADPRRRTRAEVVRRVGVAALLRRRLHQLSNGEMRKVLIARALLGAPQLLILDEPFGGLDAAYRAHLSRIVEGLLASGVRILLVTTRPEELPAAVTHVLRVEGCRIVEAGPRDRVLRRDRRAADRARSRRATRVRLPGSARGPARRGRAEVLIALRSVSVRYGSRTVLRGIDWEVRSGESWALLGPNGSGKSTLLSLITADHPQAYESEMSLFGIPRGHGESIWEIKRRIGLVAPEVHLHYAAGATCLEVVCSGFFESVGLYAEPGPRRVRAARDWLRALGLLALSGRPFRRTSEGEQRLVLLARALAKRPSLLVLDEPCQDLDREHRSLVLATVDAVGRRGTSIIWVTHHEEELPGCVTHVLRLRAGRVAYRGRRPT